ncbi:MAG: oligosaccharide flippase family protein [Planctomycetaceae bacterium]
MLGKAARRGARWGLASQAFQVAAQFVALWVLARHLDKGDFGRAGIVLAAAGVLAACADWGMGVVAVQRRSVDWLAATRITLVGGLLTAAALAATAPLLAVPALLAASAAPALLLAGLGATPRARLSRALAFRTLASLDAAVCAVACAARIAFALSGFGAWAILLGDLCGAVGSAALLWAVAPRGGGEGGGGLLLDGSRVVGTRLADAGFAQADRLLVGGLLGPASLGLYGFAMQHAMLLPQRLAPLAEQVALPILSRLRDDPATLARAYLALTRVNALLIVPFAALLGAFAPQLLGLLYPAPWQEAVPALRALCLAAACAGLNSHPGLVWLAQSDTSLRLRWSLVNLLALVGIVAAGARFGIVGVALALAGRSLLAAVVAQEITRRRAGVGHAAYLRALVPGVALGLLCAALGLLARA